MCPGVARDEVGIIAPVKVDDTCKIFTNAREEAAGTGAAVRAASRQVGADMGISLDAANQVTLQNVLLANLQADDFRFV